MDQVAEFRAHFRYDAEDGGLYYRKRGGGHQAARYDAGLPAGSIGPNGYVLVGFKGKRLLAHRVAYTMMTGLDLRSDQFVDHANKVRNDNRWENLRLFNAEQNARNQKLRSTNKSGRVGVYRTEKNGWVAAIRAGGKDIHLGCFDNFEDACLARSEAEAAYGYDEGHGDVIAGPDRHILRADVLRKIEEARQLRRSGPGSGRWGKGPRHSEETKKKIGEAAVGRKHSDDAKARIGAYWKGRARGPRTEENKNKLGKALIATSPDGAVVRFDRVTQAAEQIGAVRTTLIMNLKHDQPLKRGKFKGWNFQYA